MNARKAIEKRAEKNGWSRIIGDIDGEIWAKGEQRVAINYKMFGAVYNYMCHCRGKDPYSGINWGVETAVLGDELVVGKNKKQQILTHLRTH